MRCGGFGPRSIRTSSRTGARCSRTARRRRYSPTSRIRWRRRGSSPASDAPEPPAPRSAPTRFYRPARSVAVRHHDPEQEVDDQAGECGGQDGTEHVEQTDARSVPAQPVGNPSADARDHAIRRGPAERGGRGGGACHDGWPP